jgi:hypothetical protein
MVKSWLRQKNSANTLSTIDSVAQSPRTRKVKMFETSLVQMKQRISVVICVLTVRFAKLAVLIF